MNKENAHLYLPFVEALSKGRLRTKHGKADGEFSFGNDLDFYEIIPEFLTREELLALCGGKEPHRCDGWKPEWLEGGWRPLLRGETYGESGSVEVWAYFSGPWEKIDYPGFASPDRPHLRTRRPVVPKLVDLCAKDIPPGSAIRFQQWADDGFYFLANPAHGTVSGWINGNSQSYSYSELREKGMQILRPGNPEWQACAKEERS